MSLPHSRRRLCGLALNNAGRCAGLRYPPLNYFDTRNKVKESAPSVIVAVLPSVLMVNVRLPEVGTGLAVSSLNPAHAHGVKVEIIGC